MRFFPFLPAFRKRQWVTSVVIALAASLLATPAIAQAAPAARDAQVKREIARLEEIWIQAVIKRDSVAFNALLMPDFVYTEDDRVFTKRQLIREILTSTDTVRSGVNEDLKVTVHQNTAVATGWLVLRGTSKGQAFEVRYRYTDTWIRDGNSWRVFAAQDYKKP